MEGERERIFSFFLFHHIHEDIPAGWAVLGTHGIHGNLSFLIIGLHGRLEPAGENGLPEEEI